MGNLLTPERKAFNAIMFEILLISNNTIPIEILAAQY